MIRTVWCIPPEHTFDAERGAADLTDTLVVELDRDRPCAIHPETANSFKVVLKIEGTGSHVDIQLTRTLASDGKFDGETHYVESRAN